MAEKRRDKRGRILKTGESQKKDGTYQYRYLVSKSPKKYAYKTARTLQELRQKEDEIQRAIQAGLDYEAGDITLYELVKKYIDLKVSIRKGTQTAYEHILKVLRDDPIGQRKIKNIRKSDVKRWVVKLNEEKNYSFNTIKQIRAVLKPAFEMAIDDDAISKNPFNFKLTEVIQNDEKERNALTDEQMRDLLSFVDNSSRLKQLHDVIVILSQTGVRISELCGLTVHDVILSDDPKERRIRVYKQLKRDKDGYYISPPKSDMGVRDIPLNEAAYTAFKNVLHQRKAPKIEPMIDGCCGFIFLSRNGRPKVDVDFRASFYRLERSYNKQAREPITISPHIFRHTYCSNINKMGLNVKYMQRLMGHSDVRTTMDVYTHTDYNDIVEAYLEAVST